MMRTLLAFGIVGLLSISSTVAAEKDEKKGKLVIARFGKGATPESLFTKLDADKDGKLTTDELKKIGESSKKPEKFKADKVIPLLMEKLDTDTDGKLTADEFKKLGELKVGAK